MSLQNFWWDSELKESELNCCWLFGLCQLVEWTNVEQQAQEERDAEEARRCPVLGETMRDLRG